MTEVLLAVLVVLALVAAFASWRRLESTTVGSRVRRRCVVTMKDGEWFSGVLAEQDARALVLREAETAGEGKTVTADGEVLLLTADVAYIQFP